MTYEEAIAVLATFAAGIEHEYGDWQPSAIEALAAAAERDRIKATPIAWAFVTVWRRDVETPGFTSPPLDLVTMVEYLINEPVWTKRYYDTD